MTAAGRDRVIAHFREQAVFCRALGSPFMEALCTVMAADIETGGPVARLVTGWPGDPRRDALSLRIAGFLHFSVLAGDAPRLAAVYPAADANWSMTHVWPAAAAWLQDHEEPARRFLASPPQTNEVRRSIALLPGFLALAVRHPGPMHLLELGASAGLNQNWDRFNYRTASWQRPGNSAVTIDTNWTGPSPAHIDAPVDIGSRAACDQAPVDVRDANAALRLKAYVWPDQAERLSRLDAAIALARAMGTEVERADAAHWIGQRLAARPLTGLTVVFHSVFLQYPPTAAREAITGLIARAGAEATEERPLAWLCLEPRDLFDDPQLGSINPNLMVSRLQVWPGGRVRNLLIADGHVTRAQPLPI